MREWCFGTIVSGENTRKIENLEDAFNLHWIQMDLQRIISCIGAVLSYSIIEYMFCSIMDWNISY